jgi:phospholipase D1/2
MVVIDEKVAFMGGLDICYGRWDDHDHSIIDKDNLWSGADYNN